MKQPERTTYFVLNELLNGEEGVYAFTAGGPGKQQPDGWYWLIDNGMTDGRGPYPSKEAAIRAANAEPMRLVYSIANNKWRHCGESDDSDEDAVLVTQLGIDHYRIECGQYYNSTGVCQLEITQPLDRALAVFAGVLVVDDCRERGFHVEPTEIRPYMENEGPTI